MISNKKIIIVIPSGRQRYLEITWCNILKYDSIVDEYHFWINTTNYSDIKYIENIQKIHGDKIKLIKPEKYNPNGNASLPQFYKNCVENNTVYVKIDDDMVWTDSKESFVEFIKFRINNPQYFLVSANILNNAIISHIYQRNFILPLDICHAGYNRVDICGWANATFAAHLHKYFLKDPNPTNFYMKNWLLYQYEPYSINFISWLGEEFAKFDPEEINKAKTEDEWWFTVVRPREIKKMNCIFGEFFCVHFSFGVQRKDLEATDLLEQYKNICRARGE